MLDAEMLRDSAELPTGEFDGMSDADIEERLAAIEHSLAEDTPETVELFLASPAAREGGPERVIHLRRMFDDMRDWKLGRHASGLAELRRRRAVAAEQAKATAPPGLFFGPWRGFNAPD